MSRTRRSFTTEYKVEAAHRVIDSGRTIAEVARELGVNEGWIGRWVADERRRVEARRRAAQGGENIIDAFIGPIRRRSTAEEQAWPLIFLNSPRSSYVNGESLVTDGGFFGAVQSGQLDLTKMFDAPGATGS